MQFDDKGEKLEMRALAEDLLRFLDESPCAFHAVTALAARLCAAGFKELDLSAPLRVEALGRYFVRRGDTALVAFVVGAEVPARAGFRIVGAHTDSPGLKLKPQAELTHQGTVHLGVEVYGGPVLATWTDRDLGLCGRAVLSDDGHTMQRRLFRTGPLLSIPNVAIHLNRQANDDGLKLNPQTQLTPLLGQCAAGVPAQDAVRHLLARVLDVAPDSLLSWDAFFYDPQPATFSGWDGEFIRSGRLDDLAMCHAGLHALLQAAGCQVAPTRVLVCYDNEEVGSQTPQGARSDLLPTVLERICLALGLGREGYFTALAASSLVSADNAHAIHPGYADRSEPQHAPVLNGGPVIKVHASRAYATDAWAEGFFALACRRAGVPCQRFLNRSDNRSGSTIGSMAAAQLGIPTVDVGSAQYAMHSIREQAGTWDCASMVAAMRAYYEGDAPSGGSPPPS